MQSSAGVLALLVCAAPAAAAPDDVVARPLVLARGEVEARLTLELNLGLRLVGTPTSLAPDVWVGLTDRWTLGLTHSSSSLDRITAGASICVVELENVCDRAYRGGAIDVRFSAREGTLAIAPRARLVLRDVDPVKPALALGAVVRWTEGRFALASDPYIRFGLANTSRGNRTFLMLPLYYYVQPTCRWLLGVHVGWESDVAIWRDGYHGPLGLIVKARATDHLDVGFEGGFTGLVGAQNNIKERALMLSASWRSR